jgi:hypothetical protein
VLAGHYAAAYALRAAGPAVPLWALFVAVQAVDIVFFVFALAGVETLRVRPDARGPLAMDLVRIPYTHSLVLNLLYAAAVVGLAASMRRARAGVVLAIALLSHWMLDVIVHVHDLPLTWSATETVGWGLWQRPLAALALEIGLVVATYAALRPRLVSGARRPADLGAALLIAIQLFYVLGPPPTAAWQMAIAAEAIYTTMAILAYRVDTRGTHVNVA